MSPNPGKCFYCRKGFNTPPRDRRKRNLSRDPRLPTIDHVYPEAMPYTLPPRLSSVQSQNNMVKACSGCNNVKSRMHPVDWLTICPADTGAADLAALLIGLGEDRTLIQDALERRKSNAARS